MHTPRGVLQVSAIIFALFSGSFVPSSSAGFTPAEYPKRVATCKATKRTPKPEVVDIALRGYVYPLNSSRLSDALSGYVDLNPQAKDTMLMVHGWPSLWSTWSNQIQEFEVSTADDFKFCMLDTDHCVIF